MIDEETQNRMVDFFEVGEFAEYLGVSVEDLIAAFPDEVSKALDDIEELMQVKHG